MLYDVWKMEGAECEMEPGIFFCHIAGGKSKKGDGEMNGGATFVEIKCFILHELSSRLGFLLTEGINWQMNRSRFYHDIHK